MRARREDVHALLGVAGVDDDLARVPVVEDLVVVPLVDLGHPGGEGAQRLVAHVVGVLAAELGERLGDLGLLGRDHVGPRGPVWQRDRRLEGTVGVARVAAVEEEVGFEVGHRTEDAKPAGVRIDAPALTDEVAAPDERDVTRVLRRRRERRLQRLRRHARVVEILQQHLDADLAARLQAVEAHLAREIGVGREHRSRDAPAARRARPSGSAGRRAPTRSPSGS